MIRGGRLRATRDLRVLRAGSRLMAELVAAFYDQALPVHARGRLLDLGCGDVPLYSSYRPLIDEVVCADWPGSAHDVRHADLLCDLALPLPLAGTRFDTVILSDVLEHVPEPARLIGEIARVLVPGGVLLANVPFIYPVHEAPHDYFRFTGFALRRLVGLAGLEVVALNPLGGSLEVLADLLGKHLQFVPLAGVPAALLMQAIVRAIGGTRAGARLAERTANAYPLAFAMVARKPLHPTAVYT